MSLVNKIPQAFQPDVIASQTFVDEVLKTAVVLGRLTTSSTELVLIMPLLN
jgi:hypothetical protein